MPTGFSARVHLRQLPDRDRLIEAADGDVPGGLLQHRMLEDGAIERAMKEAPPGTRAQLRSQAIKELAGRSGATCYWDFVSDTERGVLDLSDPRERSPRWRPTHDQIAFRAYMLWRRRGCPHGSPEIDWECALRELEAECRAHTEQ